MGSESNRSLLPPILFTEMPRRGLLGNPASGIPSSWNEARSPGPGVRCLLVREALCGGGGAAVNPRDFKKLAPVLGVLLIGAVVLYVVGRFLL